MNYGWLSFYVLLFLLLNWRGVIVYQRDRFAGVAGMVSLWGFGGIFAWLVYLRFLGQGLS
jgi:hypothetical protein